MNLKTRTISYDNRQRIFWILASTFVLCLVVYVWAVRVTIANTVARANLEGSSSSLSASVGEMEFSYIALENKVSLNTAYERGFQNTSEPIYVSRNTGRSLSINTLPSGALPVRH